MENEVDFTIDTVARDSGYWGQADEISRPPHEEGTLVGCCCCCCAAASERAPGSGRVA